jgi:hypothetical protein
MIEAMRALPSAFSPPESWRVMALFCASWISTSAPRAASASGGHLCVSPLITTERPL